MMPRLLRIALLALGFLLVFGLPGLTTFYTDWLWFQETGYTQVFLTELATRGLLWVIGLAVAFGLIGASVWHALRAVPDSPVVWIGQPSVPVALPGHAEIRRLALGLTALAAVPLAFHAASQWIDVLAWWHRVPFGSADPILGHDVGFYVFTLPLLETLRGWLMVVLVLAAAGAAAVYVVAGRLGLSSRGHITVSPDVRRHLGALAVLLFLLLAAGAWLSIPDLLVSSSGLVFGASYADVAVRLPAAWLLVAAALAGAGLAALAMTRSLGYLAAAVALYVVIAVGGELTAAAVQRFVVAPNEQTRETPYMIHNIAATRAAFGLEQVVERELSGDATLSDADIRSNAATLRNVRLWDHRPLLDTFAQLQEIRPYYDFVSVDNDRYVIDGEYRQVMLSARELNSQALPNRTWVNERLVFTHGYGVTLGPVNQVTQEGLPVLFIKDLPPVSSVNLTVEQPSLYFGELSSDHVLVRTNADEFHYPRGEDNVTTHYDGRGGVAIDTLTRKLLFAVRFRSQQILFSNDLGPGSRVLYYRQIAERTRRIAPFLQFESDPYLVVADGRLFWMQDAYTTTGNYPYSTPAARDLNYIRNAVKVVVDAYHGETTFYLSEPDDPLARVLARIFPSLLRSIDEMPEGLRSHVRYPQTLFALQTAMYSTYHMTNPVVFYNKEDQWELPAIEVEGRADPMEPYYTVMKLPGERGAEFIQMVPLTPRRKDNLAAWMVARSDAPHYGELMVFRFPKQKVIFGPRQVVARINQDQVISPQITLWNQQGSEVIQGTLLVIPVEESLLYIRPLYLRAQGGRIPELKRVIVAYQNAIVMETTLDAALQRLFGAGIDEPTPGAAPTPGARPEERLTEAPVAEPSAPVETVPGASGPADSRNVAALARQARDHYQRAVAAQRSGDWATYGEELKRLGEALEKLPAPPERD
jgi:uncharacterized membrane protein (UPF0182 family)